MSVTRHSRLLARGAVAAVLVLLSGCGYVKPEDMQSQLAALRQEMEAGDRALSGRVDQLDSRVAALEQQLRALRDEFQVTIRRTKDLLTFDVPVHFGFDKAEIRDTDKPVLDRFAAVVREYYPGALVTVEGFTDPAGSRAYNLRLGMRRAEAVRHYLTTTGGLDPASVRAVSYGEAPDRLVRPGKTGAAGEPNRRVALVIDLATAAPAPATN